MFSTHGIKFSFNSVVFSSVAAYNFPILSVNEVFTTNNLNVLNVSATAQYLHSKAINKELEHFSRNDCIKAYSQDFVASRGGLLLILKMAEDNINATEPRVFGQTDTSLGSCPTDHFNWMCTQFSGSGWTSGPVSNCQSAEKCSFLLSNNITGHQDPLIPFGNGMAVDTCLSEVLPQKCQLRATTQILLVVLVLNGIKIVAMCLTLFLMQDTPLITVGDAIASFVTRPDRASEHSCLIDNNEFERFE